MPKRFFVRVQLHDVADGDDAYETLRDEMEKRHFFQVIKGNGELLRLPWGTYLGQAANTGGTKQAAMNLVQEAVEETGYSASTVIVETEVTLQVSNLDPVERPKSIEEHIEEIEELLKELRARKRR